MEINVIEFLIRAKQVTYAGKGNESESTRPQSHDLHYVEGELLYIDTYLGGSKFSGEEALWKNNVPFWSMNYIGRIIGDNFDGDFLKESLSEVTHEEPYRGPSSYISGSYEYKCEIDGDFEWFSGFEIITYNGLKIYECKFHGGLVE